MALKLKICGMKEAANIQAVAALHPDYMGFIFYKKSPRFVGDDFVIPKISSEIKKVGVFVNEKKEKIQDAIRNYNLDFVQLHGDELPGFCRDLKFFVKIIKAFGLSDEFDFGILENYKHSCDYFLFDTKTESYGGSGKEFNWNLLNNYKGEIPFFLSGGIESNHLKRISHLTSHISHLIAIDVNSKFETSPGIKDIEKLKKIKNELFGR